MTSWSRIARVGAAVLTGLWLAGSQALGVAAADDAGAVAEPSDRSAARSQPGPQRVTRTGITAPRASATANDPASHVAPRSGNRWKTATDSLYREATSRRTTSARQTAARAVQSPPPASSGVSILPSSILPSATLPSSTLPSATLPSATLPSSTLPVSTAITAPSPEPTGAVSQTSPKPASVVGAGRQPGAMAALTDARPGPLLGTVLTGITRALGSMTDWLKQLPASPLNTFLQGVVLLVRNALPAPQAWVRGTQVTLVNRTGETIAVGKVSDGSEDGAEEVVFLDPGKSLVADGYNWVNSGKNDVRLRLYTAVPDITWDLPDRWAKGSMRAIVAAYNEFNAPPELYVIADPGNGEITHYLAGILDHSWVTLWIGKVWKRLGEGDSCHCDSDKSGGPADGPAIYVERLDDSDDYVNYQVEVYRLGATDISENSDLDIRALRCGVEGG